MDMTDLIRMISVNRRDNIEYSAWGTNLVSVSINTHIDTDRSGSIVDSMEFALTRADAEALRDKLTDVLDATEAQATDASDLVGTPNWLTLEAMAALDQRVHGEA
jgi:hypothetical protein